MPEMTTFVSRMALILTSGGGLSQSRISNPLSYAQLSLPRYGRLLQIPRHPLVACRRECPYVQMELLFVAVLFGGYRCERSKQPVCFVIDTRAEKESGGRPGVRPIAEGQ